MNFFEKVKAMDLPVGEYVIFGSGPLMAHGIRESRDIDLFVTEILYSKLSADGWEKQPLDGEGEHLVSENVEAYKNWGFGTYSPRVEEIISRAEIIYDLPFASLQDVIKWKTVMGREKDTEDLKLIALYIKNLE